MSLRPWPLRRLALEMDAVHGLVLRTPTGRPGRGPESKAVVPLVGRASTFRPWPCETERAPEAGIAEVGWPAEDRAGYVDGASFIITPAGPERFSLRGTSKRPSRRLPQPVVCGRLALRAVRRWWALGHGGSWGAHLGTCDHVVAARQWRSELLPAPLWATVK